MTEPRITQDAWEQTEAQSQRRAPDEDETAPGEEQGIEAARVPQDNPDFAEPDQLTAGRS